MSRPRKNLGKYKKIIYLRDKKQMNFREIGLELEISRQRAWEIYTRAIKQGLKKNLSQIRHITGHARQTDSISAIN